MNIEKRIKRYGFRIYGCDVDVYPSGLFIQISDGGCEVATIHFSELGRITNVLMDTVNHLLEEGLIGVDQGGFTKEWKGVGPNAKEE